MDSSDDDGEFSQEQRIALGNKLIRIFLYNFVKLGYIEVTPDKSEDDLIHEAFVLAIEQLQRFEEENPGEDIKAALNMMPGLLKSISLVTDEVSKIILSAVWIEHWINGAIRNAIEMKGAPDQCFQLLSRNIGPIDKIDALWPLLDLEDISDELRGMIRRVMELRNRYVHYKWPYHDSDQYRQISNDLTHGAELAGQTIRKIVEYEDIHFHGGRAAELYGDAIYFGE